MTHDFDPGYGNAPYHDLCANAPDESVYPHADFRTEWGPVFHRGRLDGTARVLVIGQDPAQTENMARRILMGVAGHRFQGFLFKLGIDRSYTMINTFLYSVYGQAGGERHKNDHSIADYRNQWIHAILSNNEIDAAVALGSLADAAWTAWKKTPESASFNPAYAHIKHPTAPHGGPAEIVEQTKQLLQNWNAALTALKPKITHPDTARDLALYGDDFLPDELVEIPEADLPPGAPAWMRGAKSWAARTGATKTQKRAPSITVTVPAELQG